VTWKCGLAIGALVLILGLIAGISIRQARMARQIEEALIAQRDEARRDAQAARDEAIKYLADAETYRSERDGLRGELSESRARIRSLLSERPKDFEECMDGLAAVEGHVVLLEQSLELADKETWSLREAIVMKNYEINQLEAIIEINEKRVDLAKSQARRDKLGKVFIGLGVAIVGVGVGFGLGYGLGASR